MTHKALYSGAAALVPLVGIAAYAAALRLTRVDSLGIPDAAVYACLIVVGLRFFRLLSSERIGVMIQTLYCVVILIAMLATAFAFAVMFNR